MTITNAVPAAVAARSPAKRRAAGGQARHVISLDQFGFDQAALTQRHRAMIQRLAPQIVAQPRLFRTLRLVGHTDSRGPAAYNLRLGMRRAQEVRQELYNSILRLSPSVVRQVAITVDSVGAAFPVARGRDSQSRARNRRVVILVSSAPPPSPKLDDAIKKNRQLAISLGWQAYRTGISHLLGFSKTIPTERQFAGGVARWQRARGNLKVDGIIGAETLKQLNTVLKSRAVPQTGTLTAPLRETTVDPNELRRLQFEYRHDLPEGAEGFWTEGKYGPITIAHGHMELAEKSVAGIPGIRPDDVNALKSGVARPDRDPSSILDQLDQCQQHRHALRAALCQRMPSALSRIRIYFVKLYDCSLKMPNPDAASRRKAQFGLLGEALHLLQDSYSPAHMERAWGGPGGVHPILYIRMWHPTSPGAPTEHRFPADEHDNLSVASFPRDWVTEAITASREFMTMALKHMNAPNPSGDRAELNAFLDRHFRLSSNFTTFEQVIRGLRAISDPAAQVYLSCLVFEPRMKPCNNLDPRNCGPLPEIKG